LKFQVLNEEKLDEIGAMLERTPQKAETHCTGDWGFKIVSTNCHKIPENETI
jgi:hypothetical protein